MTRDEFEKLVTYWSLRAEIANGEDLGKKNNKQVKRIVLSTKKYQYYLRYTIDVNDTFEIQDVDKIPRRTGISSLSELAYGSEALKLLNYLE